MATANSINTYRDFAPLSIGNTLGKAATYLQQNYDTNVAETQQLINKYVGTDLLRDVDRQYLGERLNNLVNYVNQSGTRDWTRKSVATEIGNYISTAIDENVLAAIGSTQTYRKQQAEIAEAKKNKQWSIQNEWAATRDFQRYIQSGEVGDTYRAGTFTPYVDVTDKLLKNMDKLKDMGVEYVPTQIGGNSMFRMIGTKEILSPETARQYLGAILDTQDLQQLAIDGQYSYKDFDDDKMSQAFNDSIDNKVKYYDENIAAQNVLLGNASRADKDKIRKNIDQLESAKVEYAKLKSQNMSKEAKADYLYRSNFMDGWTNFLSFERVKDWKIDSSGFELFKHEQDMAQRNAKLQMDALQFEANYKLNQAKFEFEKNKNMAELAMKGFKLAQDGKTVIPDPNNPLYLQSTGVTSTESATPLGEETKQGLFKKNEGAYFNNHFAAQGVVGNEVKELMNKPGNEHLKKYYDKLSEGQLVSMLVNRPKDTRYVYDMLSDEAKAAIDKVKFSQKILKEADNNIIDPLMKDFREIGNAVDIKQTSKDALNKAGFGHVINNKGQLVKGVVTDNNGKYNDLNRTIAAANMKLQEGLNSDEEAIIRRGIMNEMVKSGLSTTEIKKVMRDMVYTKASEGFLSGAMEGVITLPGVREVLGGVAYAAQGVGNLFNTGKDKFTFGDRYGDYLNKLANNSDNKEYASERFNRTINEIGTRNENISSLGGSNAFVSSDLDSKKLSFHPSEAGTRINSKLSALKNQMVNLEGTVLNRTFNLNTGDKKQESMVNHIKSQLPVGTEFQSNGVMNITNIDAKSNSATVIASVKNGKVYEPTQFQIRLDQLPPSLLSNIQLEERNKVYSATNPYAVGYSAKVDIPADMNEFSESLGRMPIEKAMSVDKGSVITQSHIIQQLTNSVPQEILQKNEEKIKDILNSTYDVDLIPVQGQWVAKVTKNGEHFTNIPTGQSDYDPKLMEQNVNKIVTEAVTQRVKSVIGF